MDNELIIDGQSVPLSESQEQAPEQAASQPEVEQEEQQEESAQPEQEGGEQGEQGEESTDKQEYSLQVGDEEIPLGESDEEIDGKPAPQWVKDLRKGFKEQQKENRELKRQLEQIQSNPADQQAQSETVPPKPTLETCEWDEERFEQELTAWHEKKSRVEQAKQQQEKQQQEAVKRFQQRLEAHKERASKLPVKDYAEMEEIVRAEVPDLHKEILIHAADEGSELIAYALGKNPQLRQRLAAEPDPLRAAFMLGQLSKQVKLAPKAKQTPRPEPEVRGGGANPRNDELSKLCPGAKIE